VVGLLGLVAGVVALARGRKPSAKAPGASAPADGTVRQDAPR
jgi:hypothetical protein